MRVKLTWISTAALALGILAAPCALAENVYRWVDDDGKVHYTPTLPPEAANRPYDILSSSGVLIESVTDPVRKSVEVVREEEGAPEPLYSEREKQQIGDRLLLLKYSEEQEIVDAMELEIDHLKYDERLLETGYDSVMFSLTEQIRSAANLQRAGKPVPDQQQSAIRQLQTRIVNNRSSMEELLIRKEKIRTDFLTDLERYRLLVELESQEDAEG